MPCDIDDCDYKALTRKRLTVHQKAIHSPSGQAKQKKQEEIIRKVLLAAGYTESPRTGCTPLPGHFHREVHIDFRCLKDPTSSFARIDFVVTLRNGWVVFLEVDENQHKCGHDSIRCDLKRVAYTNESLVIDGAMPCGILFLRYNPGSYKIDGKIQRILKKDRQARLLQHLEELSSVAELPAPGSLAIQYAYYDRASADATEPSICEHEDYNETMRTLATCVCLDACAVSE